MANAPEENGPAPGAPQVRERWGALRGAIVGLIFVWWAMAQVNTAPGEHSHLFVMFVPYWCAFAVLGFLAFTFAGWFVFDYKPRGRVEAPQPGERGADSDDSDVRGTPSG